MINVLMPMGGKSLYFDGPEYIYPKPLIEIHGKTLLQHVIDSFDKISAEKRFIFILEKAECNKHHLDETIRILLPGRSEVVKIEKSTQGALCSCLLAIDFINEDQPLIVSNCDHIFHCDLEKVTKFFREQKVDAGLLCFDSVHPRWSYALIDGQGQVLETAEKRPISRDAIAGFYYFSSGREFMQRAMQVVEKDTRINDAFYTSSVINEYILQNKKVLIHKIPNDQYLTFYSVQKLEEYMARAK